MTHKTLKLRPLIEYLDSLDAPADLETLKRTLGELDVTRRDLAGAVRFDEEQYARNTISQNTWHELVCLCWKPGQGTPIHNHRASSCAFLIVEGVAVETLFTLGPDGKLAGQSEPFGRDTGYICASWDADIHQIVNQTDQELITLHIYSPPLDRVNIYSPQTGEAELWAPHRRASASV